MVPRSPFGTKTGNQALHRENGRIIEGIVLRNLSGTFSTKLMNLEYDSRK